MGLEELLLQHKRRAPRVREGAACVLQVKCDGGRLTVALVSEVCFDASIAHPIAKVVAVGVWASAPQARMCQAFLRNLPPAEVDDPEALAIYIHICLCVCIDR